MWRRHVTQRKHWRISTKEQTEAQMEASHSPSIHLLPLCPSVGSWCQLTRENEKISSLDWTSSSCRSSGKHTVKTHMTPFGQNTFIRWNSETKFTFRLIQILKTHSLLRDVCSNYQGFETNSGGGGVADVGCLWLAGLNPSFVNASFIPTLDAHLVAI